jgi:hypothetical protein
MSEDAGEPHVVELSFKARNALRTLADEAKAQGKQFSLVDILKTAMKHLTRNPTEWGEPSHKTRKTGGMVYTGLSRPISVQYVTYPDEKLVVILDVRRYAAWT